jgi:hypothetical protein
MLSRMTPRLAHRTFCVPDGSPNPLTGGRDSIELAVAVAGLSGTDPMLFGWR